MKTQDFDFYLPDTLIAQHPTNKRNQSRLLHLDSTKNELKDQLFIDLPNFLNPGDLLVFNDTRVIKARLFGSKASGGMVEVLIERVLNAHQAFAHVRASRAPKIGSQLILADVIKVTIIGREDDLFILEFSTDTSVLDCLEMYGALPLPPYITHSPDACDDDRYQTVYAKNLGAVAAPTAGLHFDDEMMALLQANGINIAYVTLHVGAGTFQPVRVDDVKDHKMHNEIYCISGITAKAIADTKQAGGKIIAIGTTSLRALESAALIKPINNLAGEGDTSIFITPGFEFKIVDQLLTNFHLPKSTLLMLVSAFAGYDLIKKAYQYAIDKQYRFFSYGDAMLIKRFDSITVDSSNHEP